MGGQGFAYQPAEVGVEDAVWAWEPTTGRSRPLVGEHLAAPVENGAGAAEIGLRLEGSAWYLYEVGGGGVTPGELILVEGSCGVAEALMTGLSEQSEPGSHVSAGSTTGGSGQSDPSSHGSVGSSVGPTLGL
ncbi:hypothetical protein GCM10023086_06340 [Streptomyces venetus]|uniref:Uncharacterized protein n=1 Tax=Streptomyces venetus TaxID=1701086 RepID=A0ABP8F3M9_9ACTN